jgi:hypothetical protein
MVKFGESHRCGLYNWTINVLGNIQPMKIGKCLRFYCDPRFSVCSTQYTKQAFSNPPCNPQTFFSVLKILSKHFKNLIWRIHFVCVLAPAAPRFFIFVFIFTSNKIQTFYLIFKHSSLFKHFLKFLVQLTVIHRTHETFLKQVLLSKNINK